MAKTRQLAAIMFTDIVGYTALMEQDEDQAYEMLKTNRSVHKPLIARFNGKFLKEIGDGILASFVSVSDAVYCAREIQKKAIERDIHLRIGIHHGEVIVDGDDVFGSGVNLASRLEQQAQPGEILISESLEKELAGRKDIHTSYAGEFELKNVSKPVDTYRVHYDGYEDSPEVIQSVRTSRVNPWKRNMAWAIMGIAFLFISGAIAYFMSDSAEKSEQHPVETASKERSIAVMPFEDISPKGDHEWLTAGLVDAINNNLINIEGLRVIARPSVVRFVRTNSSSASIADELDLTHLLQGSVLRYEDKIRVNLQLISASDNSQQWSNIYDQNMSSVYDIIDEVASSVGNELDFAFNTSMISLPDAERTSNTEAYELFLRAQFEAFKQWGVTPPIVKEYLEQAIRLDSSFNAAYAWLGLYWSNQNTWDGTQSNDPQDNVQKANELLEFAIERAPEYGFSYIIMANNKIFYEQDFSAYTLSLKGIELDPSTRNKLVLVNTASTAFGDFEKSYAFALEAMEESPLEPGTWAGKGLTEYFTGRHEEAVNTLEEGLIKFTEDGNLYGTAARVFYALGKFEDVVKVIDDYTAVFTDSRPARIIGYLAAAQYKLGDMAQYDELMDELREQATTSPIGSPAFHLAMVNAQAGNPDAAFRWLDKAIEDNEVELYWLKVEPPFKPLYDDPRWQEALEDLGFSDIRKTN